MDRYDGLKVGGSITMNDAPVLMIMINGGEAIMRLQEKLLG